MKLEVIGIEPITLCMQNTCSSQLSHTPLFIVKIYAYVETKAPPYTNFPTKMISIKVEVAGSAPASIGDENSFMIISSNIIIKLVG